MSLNQSPIEQLSVARQLIRLYTQKHSSSITEVLVDPLRECVVTTSQDNTAKRWKISTGQVINTYRHEDTVTSVQFAPNGDFIITSSLDGTAVKWDVVTGERLVEYAYQTENTGVQSVALRPDESTLFLGGSDGELQRFYVAGGDFIHSLQGHTAAITASAMGPTGEFLYSASMDCTVKRWTLRLPIREVPACVGTYTHQEFPWSIKISPANNLFFCGSGTQVGGVHFQWCRSGKSFNVLRDWVCI